MRRQIGIMLLFIGALTVSSAQVTDDALRWADSILQSLTLEERVGQVIMERAYSKDKHTDRKLALQQIKEYHIGGLCFFQGDPYLQAQMVEEYQNASKVPLFIALDAEWGLGMRFKEKAISLPKQMTMGAMQNPHLVHESGRVIGRHCAALGVNVNFAPVVDINNNPKNPVIHYRSFGESRQKVTYYAHQYIQGMRSTGVLPCIKHFPGHGDTDVDSHLDLPVIHHDLRRLDSLELYPFKNLNSEDLSMMVAHLNIPSMDSTENLPSTLSKAIVTDWIRDSIDFKGLVITDAMDMKGVTKHYEAGEAAVRAFQAGTDIILLPESLDKAHTALMNALKSGEITTAQLNKRVFRILLYKYRHCSPYQYSEAAVDQALSDSYALSVKRQIYKQTLTLITDKSVSLPLSDLSSSFASISFGAKGKSTFQESLEEYVPVTSYQASLSASQEALDALRKRIDGQDIIFIDLQNLSSRRSRQYGLTDRLLANLRKLDREKKVVLTVFGSPYCLSYFNDFNNVFLAYEDDPIMQEVAAQGVFGAFSLRGSLPVTVSDQWPAGHGLYRSLTGRLSTARPEDVGLDSDTLALIDSIVQELIEEKAAPGCQVLVAKDGKLVWNKSYGYHTYDEERPVENHHLYDLASVTKILSSTASIMALHDQGSFHVEDDLKTYIPELRENEKGSLDYRSVMAHHAGLQPWIPFYKRTMSEDPNPIPMARWYKSRPDKYYQIPVTDRLYLHEKYVDSIWHHIFFSELSDNRSYRYSDLGFYLVALTIENITHKSIDLFAEEKFYKPLGMTRTCYNPLERYSRKVIVPSEEDGYFRKERIQGHVHDMGAAMLGGVSGHAGLFSNAQDIAIFMQMLLNGGVYGGRKYLDEQTIERFTTRYPGSTRRGIGFDMKELDDRKTANMASEASESTFGHLGFTGTCVWVDPEYQLIYVFLSNRTYPTMENKRLIRNDYRPRIQSVIYRALKSKI